MTGLANGDGRPLGRGFDRVGSLLGPAFLLGRGGRRRGLGTRMAGDADPSPAGCWGVVVRLVAVWADRHQMAIRSVSSLATRGLHGCKEGMEREQGCQAGKATPFAWRPPGSPARGLPEVASGRSRRQRQPWHVSGNPNRSTLKWAGAATRFVAFVAGEGKGANEPFLPLDATRRRGSGPGEGKRTGVGRLPRGREAAPGRRPTAVRRPRDARTPQLERGSLTQDFQPAVLLRPGRELLRGHPASAAGRPRRSSRQEGGTLQIPRQRAE